MIKYALCLLALSAAATASRGETLESCAAIASRDARLACYDTLAHRPADPIPASASAAVKRPASKPQAAAPTSPAAPESAAALSAQDPANFGLTLAQQHEAFAGPKSIKARIDAINSGSGGQTLIVLESGQVWTTGESDGWLSKGEAVTIRRAPSGAYLLIASSNHTYHVRRLR